MVTVVGLYLTILLVIFACEMVQRRAARFVKGRYGMFESVTQMLEQLTWTPIKKTRKQSSHSILQNYQQFGCGTTFMSGKG